VLGILLALGYSFEKAFDSLSAISPPPGRMFVLQVQCLDPLAPMVVVDYAHTPDALEKVLKTLRVIAQERQGRLWCVFGCGGDRDPGKRPLMGAIAVRCADRVVITSDNPRSEDPTQIAQAILNGCASVDGVALSNVHVEVDRLQAIKEVLAQASAQDVVLLAGKGHEQGQEFAQYTLAFSDEQSVVDILTQGQISK
jgi:UDP-N-acetylmuramoyl-L-alanyl-D-glutamate--2,6-diaminopimelate ligase